MLKLGHKKINCIKNRFITNLHPNIFDVNAKSLDEATLNT